MMSGILGSRFFRVYVVPGAVFQSVMVGGGYGTGREIVEYFTAYGVVGGVLGIGVAYVVLAVVLALTFEFARQNAAFDYRHFFKGLLGRAWVCYEVLIVLQSLLVLAVLASAAGNILRESLKLPYAAGLLAMLVAVGTLTYYGRQLIARVLTFWSFFLYAVFIIFLIAMLTDDGGAFSAPADAFDAVAQTGWMLSGFKYALYNLAAVPLLLYVARGFETRGDALRSGFVAGAIAMVPALFFHVAFVNSAVAVLDEAIPVYWAMTQLGLTSLIIIFSVMLFGTFIETGAGMLQGIIDRIDGYLMQSRNASLSPSRRAIIAMTAILVSALLSLWGITELIAKGYGTMAWFFLFVYVLPLLTVGIARMRTSTSIAAINAGHEGDPLTKISRDDTK